MVSYPSKIMPLSIGPFPNRFQVGSYRFLLGPSVSPAKILLEYLGSFRLPLLPCNSKLPVGPRSCWIPGNELADSLVKTGATLPLVHVPCLLAPTIAKIRHTRYSLWKRTLSHNSLSCQIPSVSSKKLALSCLIRCELSRFSCHGHSLLLSPDLCRIKRKENSSCSACGHLCRIWLTFFLTASHPSLSGAPFSAPLLPFLTSGTDLVAWPDCWVSVEWLHPSLGRGRVAPPPECTLELNYLHWSYFQNLLLKYRILPKVFFTQPNTNSKGCMATGQLRVANGSRF